MPTARTTSTRRVVRGTCTVLAAATLAGPSACTSSGPLAQPDPNGALSSGAAAAPDNRDRGPHTVRVWEISYRSHTGALRAGVAAVGDLPHADGAWAAVAVVGRGGGAAGERAVRIWLCERLGAGRSAEPGEGYGGERGAGAADDAAS